MIPLHQKRNSFAGNRNDTELYIIPYRVGF